MKVYANIRYDRRRQIGVGQGMNSTVYLAHDPQLNREIAVKEIERSRISGKGWAAYYREAQAMFAAKHRNVVPIFYACRTTKHICLAMPYFRKGSLTDRLVSGPPPLKEAYSIADGILGALSQVHVAKRLHFDLKPSNILFSDTDEPMIADFGQARLLDPSGGCRTGIVQMGNAAGSPRSQRRNSGIRHLPGWVNSVSALQRRCALSDAVLSPEIREIASGVCPEGALTKPRQVPSARTARNSTLKIDPTDRYHSAIEFQDALARVDLPLNWAAKLKSHGEITWTARRQGAPNLEVHRLRAGLSGRWNVEVYTCKGSLRRRKGVATLWATELTGTEAERHLRRAFMELG